MTLDHIETNRSVEDAGSFDVHAVLQHLEANATYALVLFIDLSSAFNDIRARMRYKLLKMDVRRSVLCNWIFWTNRSPAVKVSNKSKSKSLRVSVWYPPRVVFAVLSAH